MVKNGRHHPWSWGEKIGSAKLCDQNGKFWGFILHIYINIFDPFLFICGV